MHKISTFEQYIARVVVKNGHQNDTCYEGGPIWPFNEHKNHAIWYWIRQSYEIDYVLKIRMSFRSTTVVNIIGKAYVIPRERIY